MRRTSLSHAYISCRGATQMSDIHAMESSGPDVYGAEQILELRPPNPVHRTRLMGLTLLL